MHNSYLSTCPLTQERRISAYGAYAIGFESSAKKLLRKQCVDPNDYFKHMESYKGIKLYGPALPESVSLNDSLNYLVKTSPWVQASDMPPRNVGHFQVRIGLAWGI